jgi:hypothetical protein
MDAALADGDITLSDTRTNSRVRFTIRTLIFIMLCVAGILAGYRVGHEHGYATGREKRISEEPVAKTYEVSDILPFIVIDPQSGFPRPAGSEDMSQAVPDFDSLVVMIENTIHPETWKSVGGVGSLDPHSAGEKHSLVVLQRPYVHAEIESLIRSFRNGGRTVPRLTGNSGNFQ